VTGKRRLPEDLGGRRVPRSPTSFAPPSPGAAEAMQDRTAPSQPACVLAEPFGSDADESGAGATADTGARTAAIRAQAKLRVVPVSSLQAHPLQPQDRHSAEKVQDLVASILEIGLQVPPLVRALGKGRYEVLAGHRRVRAWALLSLDRHVGVKMPVMVHEGLSDRDAIYVVAAEYAHRCEYSPLHTARVIGEAHRVRSEELGRDPTPRELAGLVPWERASIAEYIRIFRALGDPELGPLVQRLDCASKALVCKVIGAKSFALAQRAVIAYECDGAGAAEAVFSKPRVGRPVQCVTRRRQKGGFDVTFRVRPSMSPEEASSALLAMDELRSVLQAIASK
jgi:ParB/RepB/Spo0J family partition protein